jgi:hypothetical protein
MRHLKSFEVYEAKIFDKPHERLGKFRSFIKKKMGVGYSRKADFKWDVDNDNVKIFFDITEFFDPHQSAFGKGIIAWEAVKNWLKGNFKRTLNVVDHVGFVFRNNDVLHATGRAGVAFEENYQDIINNPHRFVIYRLPGPVKEDKIRQLGKELVEELKKSAHKNTYDARGIGRQLLPRWISRIFLAEKDTEQYFCSELVSNILVKAGVLSIDQLKKVYESSELDKYDEISPQKLYQLICEIGKPTRIIELNIPNESENKSPKK